MRVCAIQNCTNSTYTLDRWKAQNCNEHGCRHENDQCTCEPPFLLFPFPVKKRDPDGRLAWAKAVYRQDKKTGKNWLPREDSRICSVHFVDKKPTAINPCPSLVLGHTNKVQSRKPPTNRSLVHTVVAVSGPKSAPEPEQHDVEKQENCPYIS
jgi:hypothetical protein